MTSQHALRISGRARSIAKRSRRALVKGGVDRRVFITRLDERVVGKGSIRPTRPKLIDRAHRHVEPQFTLFCDNAGERLVFEIVEQPDIFRVLRDIDHLLGKEPRIDLMTDGADRGDSEVRLKVTMVVPGEGCYTITSLDARSQQCAR